MKNLFYYPGERKVFCEILFVLVDDCPVIISYPRYTYSQNFLPGVRWNSRLVHNLYANHEINYAIAHSLFHLKYEFKIWIPFKGWINLFYNRPNINYLTNPPCCPRSTLHINPFFLRFSSSFSFFPLCLFSNNNLILFKRTWNELFELENYEEYEESDQTSSHIIT